MGRNDRVFDAASTKNDAFTAPYISDRLMYGLQNGCFNVCGMPGQIAEQIEQNTVRTNLCRKGAKLAACSMISTIDGSPISLRMDPNGMTVLGVGREYEATYPQVAIGRGTYPHAHCSRSARVNVPR
ncbi:hypothetical protein [Pauljensenia sp. OF14-1SRA]|uniref:hypothetical protein n=1 Tax=Pauljensenia sp. OF14-1SRA TaxID=2998062 RepID=UPI0022E051F7|nr:hypothetical protein [Pauljensenia sp. OF14-1SRA]